MARPESLDWSVLSGPRVSRRTLMKVATATGAFGFAQRLAAFEAQAASSAKLRQTRRAWQEPKKGGTLRVGFQISQIVTLDPGLVSQGLVAGSVLPVLFSSLVQFDQELGLIPDLAETWEVTPDGMQYTFRLRPGLTFHNGDPLTSADLRYTYERTTNPDFASPHANKLALITSFETPDDLTVVIKLSAPFAPFLAVACSRGPGRALTPVSKRAVEELGDQQYGVTPVGCGPFQIVPESVDLSTGFEMVAFEGWYAGRPYVDRIKVTIIPEPSSMISALEAGDVDMLDIVPAQGVEQLRGNPDIVLVEAPGTNWIGLAMNYARPPWDNIDARMAVAKAINREDLVQKALFGLATPAIGAIAPAFAWAYLPPDKAPPSPQAYDLEAAKALAEKAGIVGAKPTIMATVSAPRPPEVIKNQLKDLGLDVQIESLQQAAWNERWLAKDYDWVLNGSVVDADPDDGHWNFFHSTGPWNTHGYKNERVDQLLEQTRKISDQEERARLFQEIQAILQQDVAYAFLYHTRDITGFHKDLKGYVAIPEMRYLEHVWLDR
jgi:peptide/nickel transport system substrate-binding protein